MSKIEPNSDPQHDLSAGPYKKGEGKVVFVGLLPTTEYFPEGKYAVVEFPAGPPKLAYAVVWEGTPVTITRSSDHDDLVKVLRDCLLTIEIDCRQRGISTETPTPESIIGRARAAIAKLSEGLPTAETE